MLKKIPDETKQLIQELYEGGLSVTEIAKRTKVSYSTAYGNTRAQERGFASLTEYEKHLAQERGFASLTEYEKYRAQERGFASQTDYQKHLAQERGFASRTAYQKHLAQERGFASLTAYEKHLAQEKGFASLTDYRKHLAQERGFASLTEYKKHLAQERQKRPINQELGRLVKQRLAELGKTQRWFAEQLGINEINVSRYVNGKATPRISLQQKLFNVLELPYQSLDDLVDLITEEFQDEPSSEVEV